MIKDINVCFRVEGITDQQITQFMGPRYPTRSRFIRTAIEHLLQKERANLKSQAAQLAIRWG